MLFHFDVAPSRTCGQKKTCLRAFSILLKLPAPLKVPQIFFADKRKKKKGKKKKSMSGADDLVIPFRHEAVSGMVRNETSCAMFAVLF
jgi:hypothetical protein